MWTDELFHVKKPIIALLHLRALPGDPLYEKGATMGEVIENAARELQALQEGGVDGILIANEFSLPYEKKVSYVTVAAMGRIVGELKKEIKEYEKDIVYMGCWCSAYHRRNLLFRFS